MELLDLRRYEPGRILGTGADYEVRAAVDHETGEQVVLKRPQPQTLRNQLHAGIEARSDSNGGTHRRIYRPGEP
jgi:hypothetical protein